MKNKTISKALTAALIGLPMMAVMSGPISQCMAQDLEGSSSIKSVKTPGWRPLGGEFKRGLSMDVYGTTILVYGVGSDDARWSTKSTDSGQHWSEFVSHKGYLTSAPACHDEYRGAEFGDEVLCVWASTGGILWSQLNDGEFVSNPGMKLGSDPGISGDYIFVQNAADNALWFANTKDGHIFGDWESRGGQINGRPSCLQTGSAHIEGTPSNATRPKFTCYVLGSDGAVWVDEEIKDPTPKGTYPQFHYNWTRIGGQAIGGVELVRQSGGDTVLAVRGSDSTLWIGRFQFFGAKEWQWQNYPGEINSVPACSSNHCFAILPDGQLGILDLTGKL
jgi:hypothetical protein